MKRFLVLVLAFVMLATVAVGEELDLAGMSLDELQSLHEQVEAEILNKTEALTPKGINGVLIGGKDIKPGSYALKCLGEVGIVVWHSEDDFVADNNMILNKWYSTGDTVRLYISEGTVVQISSATVTIQPATEDWVPTPAQ